jgi:hypothetical protein
VIAGDRVRAERGLSIVKTLVSSTQRSEVPHAAEAASRS